MEKVLDEVTAFADKAHGDQKRKYTPERYIVHPVRVMKMVKEYNDALPVLAAALLHDVLEDTPVTKKDLDHFLPTVMNAEEAEQTVQLVVELTDVYTNEKYKRWNRKKRRGKEAERIEKTSAASQTIKYADIIDNCKEIVEHDPGFAKTFLTECKMLLRKMTKGNEALFIKAKAAVEEALARI